jgi:hypothetical protein
MLRPLIGLVLLLLLNQPAQLTAATGDESLAPTQAQKKSDDGRFIDNGDGTVSDTRTGLMWTRADAYQRTGHWMTWDEAFVYVKKLNAEGFAAHNDWEMPTRKELRTLYEPGKINSSQRGSEMKIHIDPIFEKEGSGAHWASETNGEFNAFGVIFNHGDDFSSVRSSRAKRSVRAVRHSLTATPSPETTDKPK